MSFCNKNASESNNKTITTSVLSKELDNEQHSKKTLKANETLVQQQQQNVENLDDAANLETTKSHNENAKIITSTTATTTALATATGTSSAIATVAPIVTSSTSIMSSQLPPIDIVATSVETTDAKVVKTTENIDKTALATSLARTSGTDVAACNVGNTTEMTATKSVAFNLFQNQSQSTHDNVGTGATVTLPLTTTTSTTAATTTVETPTHADNASTGGPHMQHIASEPAFGVMLRRNQQQQQKIFRNQHETTNNQPETIRSSSSSTSSTFSLSSSSFARDSIQGIRAGSVSASASPCMMRKTSDGSSGMLSRRVSFPKSDNELVTGYLEPANPWEHAVLVKSISEIAELYVMSCQKHNTKPLQTILDHLKIVELNKTLRQPLLSLKSIKMAPSDCEALEEVFKRVQYKTIDLSSCQLNETAASALFEMIEYYEAANELDISSNAEGMTHRGWTSCTYMISHSRALQILNAQGNPISKTGAESLGHAMCTSNLHTIKLEHCGLKGAPLSSLCFKLRNNLILKELWLAHNDLNCEDAGTIAKLLTVNHYLQLVDISNNNIRDEGLSKIVKALIIQSRELEKRSQFQRTAAVDDDCGSMSPVETSSSSHFDFSTQDVAVSSSATNVDVAGKTTSANTSGILDCDASQSEDTDDEAFETAKNKTATDDSLLALMNIKTAATTLGVSTTSDLEEAIETTTTTTVTPAHTPATITIPVATLPATSIATPMATDDLDADEDTEETVKSTNVAKNNTAPQVTNSGGQSMLDKLLSMNSTDSSSDEAASNLSTDTIAACCSEDVSLISDDIFDATIATTVPTNTSTNSNATATNTICSTSPLLKLKISPTTTFLTETAPTSTTNQPKIFQTCSKISGERSDGANGGGGGENSNTESSSSSSGASSIATNNNSNHNSHHHQLQHSAAIDDDSSLQTSGIFEVTAEEQDCLISVASSNDDERLSEHHSALLLQHSTKALDVNKSTKLVDDFDDTHSTDSAFESASEGDISRNLPEEFGRLSTSFDSTRIDDSAITKELGGIETATIATESTECLVAAAATPVATPTSSIPPLMKIATQLCSEVSSRDSPPTPTLAAAIVVAAVSPIVAMKTPEMESVDDSSLVETELNTSTSSLTSLPSLPSHPATKVTIAEDSLLLSKSKTSITSPSPTPPPPSNSPGGISVGMRRTESSCAFLTPSTRHRSQSSDSLCSDTSLDGSISGDINFSTSTQINEKLAKNDTLTRQQKQYEAPAESSSKAPCGLKALALWNNNLTKESGACIAELLAETGSLELLNIGKNCLSNDFVSAIKDSLVKNTTLTTLGLQSAHLSAKGIETLSSILTFGGNSTLQRIDIRDNKLEVESLTTLAEVLKSNTTVTQIDIDDEPKRLSVGNDAHLDYARVLENVRSMCSRNEKTQSQLQAADKSSSLANIGRRRGGYYLGSRKISLTCHSRPVAMDNVVVVGGVAAVSSSTPTAANSKLDIKRKSGTRLRSPVPSPPTVSPSSSPSRSRFKVFRVNEVSPLTSPMATTPSPSPPASNRSATTSCNVAIPTSSAIHRTQSASLPTSSSLITMSSVTSSTQSIKRHSMSPRSRFHVSKIYEDPRVPLANRSLPPITPPLNPPPTPMSKTSSSSLSAGTPTPVVVKMELVDATDELNRHTPNVDSTKQMTAIKSTKNTQINSKTTLSPISSASASSSSSSPSSSSSSSTSPASLSSNSSIISSSSSSSSALSTAMFGSSSDDTDSSTNQPANNISVPSAVRCPIAIFDENDITLTKNSVNNVLSTNPITSAHITVPVIEAKEECGSSRENVTLTAAINVSGLASKGEQQVQQDQQQQQQQSLQTRTRKTSWYGNPAAVDKLLTLFQNPGNIFQRSSSPEPSLEAPAPTAVTTSPPTGSALAQAHTTAISSTNPQQQQQTSLVAMRKCSPPTWSKLGNEMIRPVTNVLQQTQTTAASVCGDTTNTASSLVTATNPVVALEQSISFLDAASKQICDFSKQVFRQNLSFGNETNAIAAATSNTATGGVVSTGMLSNNGGGGAGGGNAEIHDAAYIPSDVKLEIKENISPEHTINDETLKSLQKLCPATTVTSSVATAVATIATVATSVELPPITDVLKIVETVEMKENPCSSLAPTASATNSSLKHEQQTAPTRQTSS